MPVTIIPRFARIIRTSASRGTRALAWHLVVEVRGPRSAATACGELLVGTYVYDAEKNVIGIDRLEDRFGAPPAEEASCNACRTRAARGTSIIKTPKIFG